MKSIAQVEPPRTPDGFFFSAGVHRAMSQRDPVATGMELLDMRRGFRALWVDDEKRPFPAHAPNGVHDATDDARILYEWSCGAPDAGLAIVLPDGFACVDIDDVNVSVAGIPSGTWSEKTRRGFHHFVTTPIPLPAKQKIAGADVLASPTSYIIVSPSTDRWPAQIDAPVLPLDWESELWLHLFGRVDQRADISTDAHSLRLTRQHHKQAGALLNRMLRGSFPDTVALIVSGRWIERYPSRSEADAALAYMATHFEDDPHVLAALVARVSEKAREHPNPSSYLLVTVQSALNFRSHARHHRVLALAAQVSPSPLSTGVNDVTGCLEGTVKCVRDSVMKFASATEPDEYDRGDGWRRLPVLDIAEIHGVHRQTVWRALKALGGEGLIERRQISYRHDGGHRKDSLIRRVA